MDNFNGCRCIYEWMYTVNDYTKTGKYTVYYSVTVECNLIYSLLF